MSRGGEGPRRPSSTPDERELGVYAARIGVPLLDRLVDLVALLEGPPRFVRHSFGPEVDCGRPSRDHESGLTLPGISCHPLTPPAWWARPPADWVARQVCSYDQLGAAPGRFAWILHGEVGATGPDNEPILVRWEADAILAPRLVTEARARYEERFQAGRDSTG